MGLSAKFPKYREHSGKGEIDLINDTIKICAVDIDDIGKSISGASNATPIVITTNSAHGFSNGHEVLIRGVLGNTAANGVWKIANVASTTFQLVGSVGNGAYSAGTDFAVDLDSYEFLGDITAGARIAISDSLANKSITRGYFTSNNPVFDTPSGEAFELIVGFKDSGVVGTSPLIFISADSPNFPVTPDGLNNIVMTLNDYYFRQ